MVIFVRNRNSLYRIEQKSRLFNRLEIIIKKFLLNILIVDIFGQTMRLHIIFEFQCKSI
jgi:hypothetical protein